MPGRGVSRDPGRADILTTESRLQVSNCHLLSPRYRLHHCTSSYSHYPSEILLVTALVLVFVLSRGFSQWLVDWELLKLYPYTNLLSIVMCTAALSVNDWLHLFQVHGGEVKVCSILNQFQNYLRHAWNISSSAQNGKGHSHTGHKSFWYGN